MEKDRIIDDLRKNLEDAEEEIEYNVNRKEELKDEVKELKESVEYWQDTSQNYMEQIKSILKKKEELQTKLSDTEDELKECQEGNFYIWQYNHQLTKARDDADAELENVNKIKSEAETEVKTLKEQNKKLVTNNLKTLEKLKHENGTLNRRVGELQDEYHKKKCFYRRKLTVLKTK